MKPAYVLAALFLAMSGAMTMAQGDETMATKDDDMKMLSYDEYHALAATINLADHVVSTPEFLTLHDQGAVVIDVSGRFQDQGILGSVSINGSEITAERLSTIVPDKSQAIVLYCVNSLGMTRMVSMTHVALPQFVALGYENVNILETGNFAVEQSIAELPWGDLGQ